MRPATFQHFDKQTHRPFASQPPQKLSPNFDIALSKFIIRNRYSFHSFFKIPPGLLYFTTTPQVSYHCGLQTPKTSSIGNRRKHFPITFAMRNRDRQLSSPRAVFIKQASIWLIWRPFTHSPETKKTAQTSG